MFWVLREIQIQRRTDGRLLTITWAQPHSEHRTAAARFASRCGDHDAQPSTREHTTLSAPYRTTHQ